MILKASSIPAQRLAWLVVLIVLILCLFGLLLIFSSSSITAQHNFGNMYFFMKKQALTVAVGFFSLIVIQFIPMSWIERLNLPFYLTSLSLVALSLHPSFSHSVNGAARWIKLGPITLQPVEISKLAIILFMAKSLSRPAKFQTLQTLSSVAINLVPLFLFTGLLMLQPDFGSSVLLTLIVGAMLFLRGLPIRFVLGLGFLGVLAVAFAVWQAPYRMARLLSFMDPWASAQTSGFQIIQSYVGFFNGGFFGLGLGESKQKLFFLPEAHTDFILSVIAEELGFIGVGFLVCLFAYISWIGWQITLMQRDNFRKYLAFGLTCLIAIQASINMGVAMGLLPTKGMPLPFVSHGSSSLIVFLWVAALLTKLALETDQKHHAQKPS